MYLTFNENDLISLVRYGECKSFVSTGYLKLCCYLVRDESLISEENKNYVNSVLNSKSLKVVKDEAYFASVRDMVKRYIFFSILFLVLVLSLLKVTTCGVLWLQALGYICLAMSAFVSFRYVYNLLVMHSVPVVLGGRFATALCKKILFRDTLLTILELTMIREN